MESSTSMILIVVLSVLPGLVLIIQNGVRLRTSSQLLNDQTVLRDNVMFTLEVGKVIHRTQIERGVTSLYVNSGTMRTIDDLLHVAYQRTDEALGNLTKWMSTNSPEEFRSKQAFHKHLNMFRNQTQHLQLDEVVGNYTYFNSVFIDWMVNVFEHKTSGLWTEVIAYHMLINGKECVGIERALGTSFFTTGNMSQDTLLWYKGRHDLATSFLRQFSVYSDVGDEFRDLRVDRKIEDDVNFLRSQILQNNSHSYSVQVGLDWLNNMTEYINQLDGVLRSMAGYLSTKTEEEMQEYRFELIADIIIVLLTVIIVPLLALFVYKIAQKMEEIRKRLQEKTINLETEKKRTETLLSQLIPAKIAKRMHKNSLYPEHFESVTVMFSDLCDFSVLVKKSTPDELIELVNDIFDVFDKRIAVHNVTKIGCLGNMLMVGSGMHQRHTDTHALHVASLALDLLEKVRNITTSNIYGEKIKLKIGINTGPVVSGIVEGTFPRFCMYGQTTKDAERMMVTCLPQRIQITETTRRDLESHRELVVQERDDLNRQSFGQSEIKTYWLKENSDHAVQLDAGLLQATDG